MKRAISMATCLLLGFSIPAWADPAQDAANAPQQAASPAPTQPAPTQPDADKLVQDAMHNWRGNSSYTEITMIVHRPSWQRQMSLAGWTQGNEKSLVRFTAPAGDAGNATLKTGDNLWLYNPKLNQVIKLPFSMMAQKWMGSDFSYNDLAKSEQIVTDYTHKITGVSDADGHKVYAIECLPKPQAPIVWGKQVLKVRDDGIMLEETFFDQDMKPVRQLQTTKVAPLGGRPYPVTMRMTDLNETDHWTQLDYSTGKFNLDLPPFLFTLSNLRNPRPWRAPK